MAAQEQRKIEGEDPSPDMRAGFKLHSGGRAGQENERHEADHHQHGHKPFLRGHHCRDRLRQPEKPRTGYDPFAAKALDPGGHQRPGQRTEGADSIEQAEARRTTLPDPVGEGGQNHRTVHAEGTQQPCQQHGEKESWAGTDKVESSQHTAFPGRRIRGLS